MMVRCGACRTQFDVPGPGRFSCPVCGSVNVVRSAAGGQPPAPPAGGAPAGGTAGAAPGMPQAPVTPPSPTPDPPSPKLECPECGFAFIVGEIDVATCPNCGAEVETGQDAEDTE